jgi:dUTPase
MEDKIDMHVEPVVCDQQCYITWTSAPLTECAHGRVQCAECGNIWKINSEIGCEHYILDSVRSLEDTSVNTSHRAFSSTPKNSDRVVIRLVSSTANVIYRMSSKTSGHEITSDIDVDVAPKSTVSIKTGLLLQMPKKVCASIKGNSITSFGTEVFVFNKIVDHSHRGELRIKLINLSANVQRVKRGDSLGHLSFLTYSRPDVTYRTDLLNPMSLSQ